MKRHAALAATLAGTLFVAACAAPMPVSSGPTGSADKKTQRFTYAISGDPTSLNPLNVSDRWGLTVTNIIYSPLAHLNADGTVTNDLAESITPADDGLSVNVTLRENLRWSDGQPLDADDVVFTYTEKAKPDNGNSDALWIGDAPITAAKVDERTVRFDLPSYSAAALSSLAFETYIIPEHIYANGQDLSGTQLNPIAVGSGPYTLVSYERGQHLHFESNEHYFGDPPGIPNMTLRIVENADTVKAALQTGEVDASFVTPQQVADLEESPLTITSYPEGRVAYLGVNSAKIPDVRLRQALFFALKRDDIARASWLDPVNYEPAYSILPPSNSYATGDIERYDHNVNKARDLLATPDVETRKLTLGYWGSDPAQTTQATLIQQQLSEIGIEVELSGVDSSALTAEIRKGSDSAYDLFLGGYIMGPEPDAYSVLFRSGARSNYFAYSSTATDALFDAGIAARDVDERKLTYAQLQRQIAADAVIYPIGDNLKLLAVNNRIGGVEEATPVPIYTLLNFGKLTEK